MDPMPLFSSLVVREPGMQNGDLFSEYAVQVGGRGGRKSYFGNQQNRGASLREDRLHRRQIYGSLAGPGHAMQQRYREAPFADARLNRIQCAGLRGVQMFACEVRR